MRFQLIRQHTLDCVVFGWSCLRIHGWNLTVRSRFLMVGYYHYRLRVALCWQDDQGLRDCSSFKQSGTQRAVDIWHWPAGLATVIIITWYKTVICILRLLLMLVFFSGWFFVFGLLFRCKFFDSKTRLTVRATFFN